MKTLIITVRYLWLRKRCMAYDYSCELANEQNNRELMLYNSQKSIELSLKLSLLRLDVPLIILQKFPYE
ncbi:hypothetical protein BDD14_6647 [Edaphobacter modestus]|uniref:Uncharacterized protein n=2 Tax=Edaphobacter modestus TaxID=388466 RepID=A0A4Q7XZQ9_9BACT|nr:hypothetical protein BDD14_6647 [Edaphobacter modestus]